jgi:uncharacterized protein
VTPATPWSRASLPIALLPLRLAVCRLDAGAPLPAWASEGALSCVTRTPAELSVVVEERVVPGDARAERGYRAFVVRGPLPFDLVGVFASMAGPLADAGISIFALSTFDTDYVLVKARDVERASGVLRDAGHDVTGDG